VRDTLLWELARFRGGWSDFVTEGHWVPPGTWPPIRAVLLAARGDRPAAQASLAGYSLEQDRRHGVRRHDGWMPVIITEAVVSVGSEAQQEQVYDWMATRAGAARDRRSRRLGRTRPRPARGRPTPTRRPSPTCSRARQHTEAGGRRVAAHIPGADVNGPPRQGHA
jgi:hypothetical protein